MHCPCSVGQLAIHATGFQRWLIEQFKVVGNEFNCPFVQIFGSAKLI
ncbi:MAG: hypothetical protein N3B10_02530 [Armatimonadetes bacterium]|nr:hypothetical protein [Armatimonadota bacterium]MCX7967347.1 hypothetical protein [Armatimonadota bacterium]MDW8144153.1 hypothetical protein [Armatimonadota bacterium]